MALPTDEKTLLALDPINRIVPTTITRISQHHGIFGDILTLTLMPQTTHDAHHGFAFLVRTRLAFAGKPDPTGISGAPQGWQSDWTLGWLGRILRCGPVSVKRSEFGDLNLG